jgi:hypothetical protein
MSAEMMFKPFRPRRIVRNSRVDHPPVSGVPVAGAADGSRTSMSMASVGYPPFCQPISSFQKESSDERRTEVHWFAAYCIVNLLDDTVCPYDIDFPGL